MAIKAETDAELIARLTALYAAAEHSAGARDDFWDFVSLHIGRILDLAKRGDRANAVLEQKAPERPRPPYDLAYEQNHKRRY